MVRTAHALRLFARHPAAMGCRILVVDDDDLFAELLTLLLSEQEGLEVIGRARDGVEAVELVARLEPDVVTMDIEMPRLNGIDATARISELDVSPHVVVVSSSLFADAIAQARIVGAHGYVTKSKVQSDLVRVVLGACRGEAFQEVS